LSISALLPKKEKNEGRLKLRMGFELTNFFPTQMTHEKTASIYFFLLVSVS